MIELYHYPLSTCSQKVRLVLAEKGLDFISREVNIIGGQEQHDPEYVKLNPKHVVPTLVQDGHVFVESSLIIKYLDDAYPDPPMRPVDAIGRYTVDAWLHRCDEEVHPAAPIVSFAIGPRSLLMQQPREVREANIESLPDPADRATRRSVLEHGVLAPEFAGALKVFVELLDGIEAALGKETYLSGEAFGLADASVVPYVLRLEHLGMDPLLDPSVRPALAGWFSGIKTRPGYQTAVDAWVAPAIVEMMRNNGMAAWPDIERLL